MKLKRIIEGIKVISESLDREIRIMEVCGTHTVNIFRFGIKTLLPENIKIISGPGCPVCVTPDFYIENAVNLAKSGIRILTFGDMVRVPGISSSLEEVGNYEVVYSPFDIFGKIKNSKEYVFLGVGFETTTPLVAWLIEELKRRRIKNVSVYSAHKLIPPPLEILDKESRIDGFILPGHVSTIIGRKAYLFLNKPSVISGFEAEDILQSIFMLIYLIKNKKKGVLNQYKRSVRENGNLEAKKIIYDVFESVDSVWRGLGMIKKSGLEIKKEYKDFDAEKRYGLKEIEERKETGCRCGEVIKGEIEPVDCPLFAKKCTPERPLGPCMVSSEGTCSAYYKYGISN